MDWTVTKDTVRVDNAAEAGLGFDGRACQLSVAGSFPALTRIPATFCVQKLDQLGRPHPRTRSHLLVWMCLQVSHSTYKPTSLLLFRVALPSKTTLGVVGASKADRIAPHQTKSLDELAILAWCAMLDTTVVQSP